MTYIRHCMAVLRCLFPISGTCSGPFVVLGCVFYVCGLEGLLLNFLCLGCGGSFPILSSNDLKLGGFTSQLGSFVPFRQVTWQPLLAWLGYLSRSLVKTAGSFPIGKRRSKAILVGTPSALFPLALTALILHRFWVHVRYCLDSWNSPWRYSDRR